MAGALVERDLPAGGTSGQYLKIGTALLPEWAAGDTVAGHAASHQNGGTDEIATATPGANVIPKAGADSKLAAGFIPQATTSAVGGAELATAAEIVTGTSETLGITPKYLKDAADLAGMWLTKRTKMPDGATAVDSQDAWATVAGFSTIAGNTLSVSATPGNLRCTVDSGTTLQAIKILAGIDGKTCIMRIRASKAMTMRIETSPIGFSFPVATEYSIVAVRLPIGSVYFGIKALGLTAGDWIEIDWEWVGDYSYPPGSLSEEAARIADQLGDTAGVGVAASGTITSNLTNVSDADTVTIAGKVYTFKTSLTPTEGEVLIGADYQASLVNLVRAIMHTGTPDTDYKCAAAHPLVSAVATSASVTTITALSTGILGNQITLAKSAATLTLSGTTLTGGIDDVGKKIITQIENNVAGSGTRPAAAKIELTNTALIGYETTVDVAKDATFTLPAGGTWFWNVYGYGATISSAKRGSSAGGTTLTVAGANASVGYRRTA